jgi:hypothetical protein
MDPIAAIGSANSNHIGERAQSCNEQLAFDNLQTCAPKAPGAHLDLQAPLPEVPAQMNLAATAHMFADAMTNGFYVKQFKELVRLTEDPKATVKEKTVALMDTNERIELAKLMGKLSSKLVEGIQTVVTKSG